MGDRSCHPRYRPTSGNRVFRGLSSAHQAGTVLPVAISQKPTTERPIPTWARLLLVFGLLYTFLAGVKFLESGIKEFGSDVAADLFDGIPNPLAGLFAGVLATVLVQSSSVTTPAHLIEADALLKEYDRRITD